MSINRLRSSIILGLLSCLVCSLICCKDSFAVPTRWVQTSVGAWQKIAPSLNTRAFAPELQTQPHLFTSHNLSQLTSNNVSHFHSSGQPTSLVGATTSQLRPIRTTGESQVSVEPLKRPNPFLNENETFSAENIESSAEEILFKWKHPRIYQDRIIATDILDKHRAELLKTEVFKKAVDSATRELVQYDYPTAINLAKERLLWIKPTDESALLKIAEGLKSPYDNSVEATAVLLQEIGSPVVSDHLVEALKNPSKYYRSWVTKKEIVKAIGDIKSPAIPTRLALIMVLFEPIKNTVDESVRLAAVKALRKILTAHSKMSPIDDVSYNVLMATLSYALEEGKYDSGHRALIQEIDETLRDMKKTDSQIAEYNRIKDTLKATLNAFLPYCTRPFWTVVPEPLQKQFVALKQAIADNGKDSNSPIVPSRL